MFQATSSFGARSPLLRAPSFAPDVGRLCSLRITHASVQEARTCLLRPCTVLVLQHVDMHSLAASSSS